MGDDEDRRRVSVGAAPAPPPRRPARPACRCARAACRRGRSRGSRRRARRLPGAAPAARASRRSSTGSRAGGAATGPRRRASARRAAGRRPPRSRRRRASSRPSRSARRKPMPAMARLGSRSMSRSRSDPHRLAAIYAGGVIGALARVGLAEAAPHGAASWPWATFAANMAGALLLGCFVAVLRGHREESPGFALLTTGICGTLTTFATFQLELFEMVDARPPRPRGRLRGGDLAAGYLLVRAGLAVGVLLRHRRAKGATPAEASDERRGLDRGRAARRRDGGRPLRARRRPLRPSRCSPSRSGSSPSTCSARCVLGVVAGAALGGEALVDRRRRRDRLLHHLLDLDAGHRAPRRRRPRPTSPGSTSASRCSPASPPSPSATGSAGRSEQGKVPRSPSAAVSTLNRETKERDGDGRADDADDDDGRADADRGARARADPAARPPGRPAGEGRLRGARSRAAPQAQRRALAEADPRRRHRHGRGGRLGGGRGPLRPRRSGQPGVRRRQLRGQRALGGEDQAHLPARGGGRRVRGCRSRQRLRRLRSIASRPTFGS